MAESKIANALTEGMQIPCPKCFEPMNMAAQRCPHCKYEFSDDEVRANIASKKAMPSGCLKVFGVIGAIVAVVVLVGVVIGPVQKTATEGTVSADPVVEEPDAASTDKMSAGEEYAWKEAAKEVVGKQLRDPESAIYSDMHVYPGTGDKATIICGYVNSRNGFGGMTGPQRFIAGGTVLLQERFTKQQMHIAWSRFCKQQ